MRIRRKVLASAFILTSIGMAEWGLGNPVLGLIIILVSFTLHMTHFVLYFKKVQ